MCFQTVSTCGAPPPWEPADDVSTAAKFPVCLERETHHVTHACRQILHPSAQMFVALSARSTCDLRRRIDPVLATCMVATLDQQLCPGPSREQQESVEQPLLWDDASSMRPKMQHPGQGGVISILCSASLRSEMEPFLNLLKGDAHGRVVSSSNKLGRTPHHHCTHGEEVHHINLIQSPPSLKAPLIRAEWASCTGSGSDHDGTFHI